MRTWIIATLCALACTEAGAEPRRFLEDTCTVTWVSVNEKKEVEAVQADCVRSYKTESTEIQGKVFQYDGGEGKTWPAGVPRDARLKDRWHCPETNMEVEKAHILYSHEVTKFLLTCRFFDRRKGTTAQK